MLKVGDKVRLSEHSEFYPGKTGFSTMNPRDTDGIIDRSKPGENPDWLHIEWSNGMRNSYHECDLILIESTINNNYSIF